MMMKSLRICFILASVFISSKAWAFADRIDAPIDEIYASAKTCFADSGFSDENPEKKSLTTKWVQTVIDKTRRHAFVSIKTKEKVLLRYRMKIDLEEEPAYTYVSMVGRFEEKPLGAPPQLSWKPSVSTKELYFKERESFFKLLGCVEAAKKAASQPVSAS